MLDTSFPRVPGDIGNGLTWPFPVLYRTVAGASSGRVVGERAAGLLDGFVEAGCALIADGADGITTSCGFLSLFQGELAERLAVPVATSSLLQVPVIERLLPAGKAVGILTISAEALTPAHLAAVGVAGDTIVMGMKPGGDFARVFLNNEAELDFDAAETDILAAGAAMRDRHPNLGAIVLECTNMVPHARRLRDQLGLPVFSIYSFVTWFQAGLGPRRFKQPEG